MSFFRTRNHPKPSQHWSYQRLTAVALIPLSLWLLVFLRHAFRAGYSETLNWCSQSLTVLTLSAWLLIACYHAALGIQVVLEDYVAEPLRQRLAWLSRLWFTLIAAAGLSTMLYLYWQGRL